MVISIGLEWPDVLVSQVIFSSILMSIFILGDTEGRSSGDEANHVSLHHLFRTVHSICMGGEEATLG